MGLKEDITEIRSSKPRYFRQWLEQATPEDKTLVMEAIYDTNIHVNKLVVLLTMKHDIPITRATVEKYRDARR